jgi:hypothetical protein
MKNKFDWKKDMPQGPQGSLNGDAAFEEAKRQLAAEGYTVDGYEPEEEQYEEYEAEEEYQEDTSPAMRKNWEEYVETEDTEESSLLDSLLSKDDSNLLETATVRLEMARLYEMVLKTNFFDGLDADPRAVSKVMKEFKEFTMDRLEILLGMKQEKQKTAAPIEVKLPFNELEISSLKDLAFKLTKGETAKYDVLTSSPKTGGLKPLSQVLNKPTPKPIYKPALKRPQPSRPAPRPTAPLKSKKQIHEMNENELRERNKQVRAAPKGVPGGRVQPLPMPDDGISYGGGAQAGETVRPGGPTMGGLLAGILGAGGIENVGNGE